MRATDLELGLLDLIPVAGRQRPGRRSGGVHVSTLVGELWEEVGGIPERKEGDPTPEDPDENLAWALEIGSAFEETFRVTMMKRLNRYSRGRIIQPRSSTLLGLTGTPDFIDRRDKVIGETKLTKKSSFYSWSDRRFWGWLEQLKAYIFMHGLTTGRLYALFINGDYRKNRGYTFRGVELEFSPYELIDTYRMLLTHAHDSGRMKKAAFLAHVRDLDLDRRYLTKG